MLIIKLLSRYINTFGSYLILMGRSFSVPERMRMFAKRYIKEMSQLVVDSIPIVLLISFFIGAVICIQMKVNIQSPWMPRWVSGYTTREIMLLEFSSSIMCLILSGKVGSNIASELGRMRNEAELTPIISRASICWVTRMVPNSEAMLEPTLPERMRHMMELENSSSIISRVV